MNKFLYKEQYAYTLEEVIKFWKEGDFSFLSQQDFKDLLDELHLYSQTSNPLGLVFVADFDLSTKVLNRVLERYKNHYALVVDEVINSVNYRSIIEKIVRVLDLTYPKYSTLLKLYEDNKTHLMDKLASSESETHSTSQNEQHADIVADERKLKMNDTPQTEDVNSGFEADQYVSELHKEKSDHSQNGNSSITGSGSITRSHSSDPTTIMERIAEIQNKYQNLMLKWLNEFDKLFIEEGNI